MATCDDDFGLLADDDAQHQPTETHPNLSPPPPPQGFYLPQKTPVSSSLTDAAASHFSPASRDENRALDWKNNRIKGAAATKRRGGAAGEEPGYVGEYYFKSGVSQGSKKARGGGGASWSGADCRKDREEWSDGAISSLLDAYSERFQQLKRGNLSGRDWEDVAAAVSEQHLDRYGGGGKSVEQCKNKIDNLKKWYKVECQRIAEARSTARHWPWFKKMEFIVGRATFIASPKPASSGADDKPRHQQQRNNKRLTPPSHPRWKRALLKIGGSLLAGDPYENVDPNVIMLIAREVQVASHRGVQVAIVVGSRNIYCGDTWAAATGIDRAAA